MAKEVLGNVICPHCGQLATVHQNARSSRSGTRGGLLYYRCGEILAGGYASSGCGTVQIYGASGQAWLRKMTYSDPIASPDPVPQPGVDPVPDPVPTPKPDPVPDPIADPVPPRKKGIFARFTEELTDL